MAGGCPVALPRWWLSVTHQGRPPFVAEKIFQKQLSQRGPIFVLNDEKTPPEKLIMGARSLVQGPLIMGARSLDGLDMLAVSARAHAAPRCFVSKRCQQTIFASQASNRIDMAKMHRKWKSIYVFFSNGSGKLCQSTSLIMTTPHRKYSCFQTHIATSVAW